VIDPPLLGRRLLELHVAMGTTAFERAAKELEVLAWAFESAVMFGAWISRVKTVGDSMD
jgi:hypothetical protein